MVLSTPQYHPDKNPSPDAEEKFKEVRYDVLLALAIHVMLLTPCLELAKHTECSQIQCVCPSFPLSECPQVGADAVS